MISLVKLYAERADNELILSESLFKISSDALLQLSQLKIEKTMTFYSAVITHAYYCIFYSAKAVLLTKEISTKPPEEHSKTLEQFKKHFVDSGKLDRRLLTIYNSMAIKASGLLGLFRKEKQKRGQFTYKTIAQANIEPAEESIANAKQFVGAIKHIIEI